MPAQTVHGTPQSPQLPASLATPCWPCSACRNYQPFVSNAVHADQKILDPQSSSTSQCIAETGLPKACNTPADFAQHYNLDGLYRRGALGQGRTVAIVTLAALDPGAPQFFWKNVLGMKPSGRTVTVTNVDGGPGAPSDASGTGETDLDAEQSGALAPDANVIVYQAPNTDPGFFDAFSDAASQNIAELGVDELGRVRSRAQGGRRHRRGDAGLRRGVRRDVLGDGGSGAVGVRRQRRRGGLRRLRRARHDRAVRRQSRRQSLHHGLGRNHAAVHRHGLRARRHRSAQFGQRRADLGLGLLMGADRRGQRRAASDDRRGPVPRGHRQRGGFSDFESQPSYQRGVPGTSSYTAVPYFTSTDIQDIGGGVFEPTAFGLDRTHRRSTASAAGARCPIYRPTPIR